MSKPAVELSIVMAGAVSAGAYTGGVMTRLFEIMDAIENFKSTDPDSFPIDLRVRIVGGTSAGGVNAATTAIVADKKISYTFDNQNPFYATWVSQVSADKILAEGMTCDLTKKPVSDVVPELGLSLVNAAHLDEIGWHLLSLRQEESTATFQRSWLPNDTRYFFTATNIAGVAYKVNFITNEHWMRTHRDWVCFSKDKEVSYSFNLTDEDQNSWFHLRDAALATAAFPLGLSPRALKIDDTSSVNHYEDPVYGGKPDSAIKNVKVTCVDGGVLNNEPFVTQNKYLIDATEKEDLRISILIDPFPDAEEDVIARDIDVKDTAGSFIKMFSAWKNTCRFKPEAVNWDGEYVKDNKKTFMFAINPSRWLTRADAKAKNPLASALWSGFFGFMDERFRDHDFKLGYLNADWMLLKHFKIATADLSPELQQAFVKLHQLCGNDTATLAKQERAKKPLPLQEEAITYLLPVGLGDSELFTMQNRQPDWPMLKPYQLPETTIEKRVGSLIKRKVKQYTGSADNRRLQKVEELIEQRIEWVIGQVADEASPSNPERGLLKKIKHGVLYWGAKRFASSIIKEKTINSFRQQLKVMYDDR